MYNYQHEFLTNVWLERLTRITSTHFLKNDFFNYLDDVSMQNRKSSSLYQSYLSLAGHKLSRMIDRLDVEEYSILGTSIIRCDFNNFFVGRILKEKVYSVSIKSKRRLKDRIVDAVQQITEDQCLKTIRALNTILVLLQEANILNICYIKYLII